MNVVPFPKLRRQADEDDLFCVIACLRSLGEPATTTEIRRLLESLGGDAALIDVDGLLRGNCDQGEHPEGHAPLFRKVVLTGREAWAFTQVFRETLRSEGLSPVLRAGA